MTELRVNCLHTLITGWGTPQARCDACGATFDWRGRDLVAEAQKLIDAYRAQQHASRRCVPEQEWQKRHEAKPDERNELHISAAVALLEQHGYVVRAPFVGTCAECSATFVVKRGKNGAPRRKFCGPECMHKSHNRDAVQRVLAARQKKRDSLQSPRR